MRLARFLGRRWILFWANLLAAPTDIMVIQRMRAALLRLLGMRIGAQCQFSESLYVLDGRNVKLGNEVRLGSFCRIWDFAAVEIGDRFLASHNLTIVAGTHELADYSPKPGPVRIGADVWIGANVTIIGPVQIGDRAVIGAGAVVVRDIPSGMIAVGVPARAIKERPTGHPRT